MENAGIDASELLDEPVLPPELFPFIAEPRRWSI
jgi:hypothetical protein